VTAAFWAQVGHLARRSALRTLRQPASVVPALVFPLLLLAVNTAGLDAVTRLLAPLRNRIANMIARAVVQLVADGGKLQALQLVVGADEGEERAAQRVHHFGHAAFVSNDLLRSERQRG